MYTSFVISILFLIGFWSFCACLDEPRCSKYDFEEKVLEKVLRFEHKMEIMTETLKEFSTQMKDEITQMNGGITQMKMDWTDTKERFQEQWTEMKNGIELMKDDVIEREKMLNDSIHKTMQSLAAKIHVPESHYAFSAYDLSSITMSTGSVLVFTQTLVNDDGVYSTTTGKFTAPSDGVYEFHATLSGGPKKKGIWVEFKAGEVAIGRFQTYDYDIFTSASGSAIGRLLKGTQVYLRVTTVSVGFKFLEDTYRMCTFSGHLINK